MKRHHEIRLIIGLFFFRLLLFLLAGPLALLAHGNALLRKKILQFHHLRLLPGFLQIDFVQLRALFGSQVSRMFLLVSEKPGCGPPIMQPGSGDGQFGA